MDNSITEYPEEFWFLVLTLQRHGNRQLNTLFNHLALTRSQAEAMEIIGTHNPMSTRKVEEYLICESGNLSRLFATLASKNLTMTS